MTEIPDDLLFLQWLIDHGGMIKPKILDQRRYAAVLPKMFTHAIIVGQIGDTSGYDDTWCYRDRDKALTALEAWDGQGEPTGWKRHPITGRRISDTDELDQDGNLVPAGVMYINR